MAEERIQGLYRMENGVVGGVCAGFADRYNVDIIVPRILVVLITLVTFGIGAIVYLVLWARLPERSLDSVSDPYDVMPDYAGPDGQEGVASAGLPGFGGFRAAPQRSTASLVARVAAVVGLVVLFLVVAAMVPPFIPGTQWWQFWPAAFLVVGVFLVIVPIPSKREMAWHMVGIVVAALSAMALPMSLDLVSWGTIPFALRTLWFLVVAGAAMFAVGVYKNDTASMVGGAVCLVAFCLFSLVFLAIPGEAPELIVVVAPDNLRLMPF